MAKFELADFLTISFIRQFMKNQDGIRTDVINLFRKHRHLAATMLFQSRYFYRNMGMLIVIFISPKLARRLWHRRDNSFNKYH